MKRRNNIKRILSLLLLIFQIRIAGSISNLVNSKGVKSYTEFINNLADFFVEQNITDPQHIYEYFNYAMWNGYLSRDSELKYSIDRKIYLDNPGMSIASGSAVCLNYADMLACIYKELGFNSYMAMCYVDGNSVSVKRIRTDVNIERKINKESEEKLDTLFNNVVISNVAKILGNHAVTCVEYKGEIFIFDPTNLVYLNKSGFNNIDIINGDGKFDIRYFTSILYDNVNLFKLITNTNNKEYELEVINKPELVFDIEGLENFYKENKDLINEIDKVNKRGSKSGTLEITIYCILASFILNSCKNIIKKLALKCKRNDIKDIKNISKELKEYFKQQNIVTEYEVLKNYELINKSLGIKNSICKDALRKFVLNINNLINEDIFYNNILVILLNELGYESDVCYVNKYIYNIPIGFIDIIEYKKDDICYYYDPEIGELLFKNDTKILYSKNKKYKYYKKYGVFLNTLNSKEEVKIKMTEEDILLNKTNLKELKKGKILRKNN